MAHISGLTLWLLIALIILVWPVFFIALWSAIVYSMSFLGGWHRLAKRYRANAGPLGGKTYPLVTGMVGISRYKRVLTVTCAAEGLYLGIRWVFRMGHPTLFIPWADIGNARKMTLFYWEYVGFDVGTPKIASLRLPLQVFDGTPVFIEQAK